MRDLIFIFKTFGFITGVRFFFDTLVRRIRRIFPKENPIKIQHILDEAFLNGLEDKSIPKSYDSTLN